MFCIAPFGKLFVQSLNNVFLHGKTIMNSKELKQALIESGITNNPEVIIGVGSDNFGDENPLYSVDICLQARFKTGGHFSISVYNGWYSETGDLSYNGIVGGTYGANFIADVFIDGKHYSFDCADFIESWEDEGFTGATLELAKLFISYLNSMSTEYDENMTVFFERA